MFQRDCSNVRFEVFKSEFVESDVIEYYFSEGSFFERYLLERGVLKARFCKVRILNVSLRLCVCSPLRGGWIWGRGLWRVLVWLYPKGLLVFHCSYSRSCCFHLKSLPFL